MASGDAGPPRAQGSARSPRRLDRTKDQAITAAVVDVLDRLGLRGFTMDEVALSAGVGKAAIYRRWAGKTDLLASYTEGSIEGTLDVSDTGSLRTDLIGLLASAVAHFNGPAGRANRALLSAVHDDPALAAAYHSGPVAQWAAAFDEVLRRAVGRGEIAPTVDASLAAEAGAAILVQRWLLLGQHIDEELVTAVVDRVVLPLLRDHGAQRLPDAPAPGTPSSER
ncbi:TetR/AcrR family transcriptional regulator [Petropleomorpha daqingensis]|uniref:AcrR family transcriptional regulator n=1 Tax=Petropleomorpha daqingensis TaxID=2026353 RepID=A0A853CGX5_9ACTN|nr:TetR/AcrR family transcriptional regulator [Petropleomorpha daqingensis]NYJ06707.1 AcrR family transcriptional regulator [Petropleomorpha daqingensis]